MRRFQKCSKLRLNHNFDGRSDRHHCRVNNGVRVINGLPTFQVNHHSEKCVNALEL